MPVRERRNVPLANERDDVRDVASSVGKSPRPNVTVGGQLRRDSARCRLLRLDPASVDLSREGVHRRSYGWPLAWTRSYGRGRVFYTGLGHEQAVWQDARYQRLLLNAIRWSMQASN